MKKAVSPLIATVLLIAITLAIGGFMSLWTQQIARSQTEQAVGASKPECAYVSYDVKNATYDTVTNRTKFDVENTGTKNILIDKVQIVYVDDMSTYAAQDNGTILPSKRLDVGTKEPFNFGNTTTNSTVRQDMRYIRVISSDCPTRTVEVTSTQITVY